MVEDAVHLWQQAGQGRAQRGVGGLQGADEVGEQALVGEALRELLEGLHPQPVARRRRRARDRQDLEQAQDVGGLERLDLADEVDDLLLGGERAGLEGLEALG